MSSFFPYSKGPLNPVPHPHQWLYCLTYNYSFNKNNYLIIIIGIKIRPLPSHIGLNISYRFLSVKLTHDIGNNFRSINLTIISFFILLMLAAIGCSVSTVYIRVCICRHTYTTVGMNYCCLEFFLFNCDMIRLYNTEEQQGETETLENVEDHVAEWARFSSLLWPQWFPNLAYKWNSGRLLYSCHQLRIKLLKMSNSLKYYSKPFKWYSTSHSMLAGEGECGLYYCNFLTERA